LNLAQRINGRIPGSIKGHCTRILDKMPEAPVPVILKGSTPDCDLLSVQSLNVHSPGGEFGR